MFSIVNNNIFTLLILIADLLCVLDLHALADLHRAYFSNKTIEIITKECTYF